MSSQNRWVGFADGLIEASIYLAVLLTPILVDVNLQRIFALPKVALIRLLAVVILAAWLFTGLLAIRARRLPPWRRLFHQPLAWPITAFVATLALSTVVSVWPQASVWGDFLRVQGTLTVLSLVVIGVAVGARLRQPDLVERVIDLILLASWPVMLYGILQFANLDPLTWQNYTGRILSLLGNPIFLGAYVVLTLPLTLYRLATLWTRHRHAATILSRVGLVWAVGLLVSQALVLVFSQSRGPFLATLVELFFLVILLAKRRRVVMTLFAVALVGLTLLVVINLPGSPLAPVRRLPAVGRLTNLTDTTDRGLIWSHVTRLLASNPARLVSGYGPETLDMALIPFYSRALVYLGGQAQQIDRTHNVLLDALASSGVLGLAALLWLLLAGLALGLRQLGLIRTRAQQTLTYALPVGGGLALALAARVLSGTWTWSGLAGGLGVTLGWGLALWLLESRASAAEGVDGQRRFLVAALTVALLGQFVEAQFSPSGETTLLYGWVYLGLLMALALPQRIAVSAGRSVAGAPQGVAVGWPTHALAVLIALLTSLIIVGLVDWTPPFTLGGHLAVVLAVAAATWVVALTWVAWQTDRTTLARRNVWTVGYLSLSMTLTVLTVYSVSQFVSLVILPVALVYAALLAGLVALAIILRPDPGSAKSEGQGELVPVAALGLIVLALVALLSFLPHVGDRYFALGRRLISQGQIAPGLDALARARQAAPQQDVYYLISSDLLASLAAGMGDPQQQAQMFDRARALGAQAVSLKPGQPYTIANLAHIELRQAEATTNPQLRAAAIQRGLDLHEKMASVLTFDPAIYDDWGYLYTLKRDYPRALEKYQAALKLERDRAQTLLLMGHAQREAGDLEGALQTYNRAIASDTKRVDGYAELVDLLLAQGRAAEALPYAEDAVKLAPDRYALRTNLGIIYSRLGRNSEAAEELKVALRYAPAAEEARLRALLQQVSGN